MSRLFSNDADHPQPGSFGADALWVRGEVFRNSAAKFWSSLADEIASDYPACSSITISAMTGLPLSRTMLSPASLLELGDFVEEAGVSPEAALREVMAEMKLFGMPGAVRARLFDGEREIAALDMPNDCVDADILPYLLAWLLEWSGVPDDEWSGERVCGEFVAFDRKRRRQYHFKFTITARHVSEGLYLRAADITLGMRRGASGIAPENERKVNA